MANTTPGMPSEPPKDVVYETADNPVSKEPFEDRMASRMDQVNQASWPVEQRIPQQQASISDATASAMGRGIRAEGATGEEARGMTNEELGRHNELDAEQMAAPGEGDVASAVEERKGASGMSGGMLGMETDLDRKKREQAPLRESIQEARRNEVDVGGVLGQRGGPANPVDKGGYPNAGNQ